MGPKTADAKVLGLCPGRELDVLIQQLHPLLRTRSCYYLFHDRHDSLICEVSALVVQDVRTVHNLAQGAIVALPLAKKEQACKHMLSSSTDNTIQGLRLTTFQGTQY